MKNSFEDIPVEDELAVNSKQKMSEIIDNAETWLIMRAGGSDNVDDWTKANSERLRALVNDPKNKYIEGLANESTREATLNEIKTKLYH